MYSLRPALTFVDDDSEHEPPNTPAPVFAARALKSAIFGTPTPLDKDPVDGVENELAPPHGNAPMESQPLDVSPVKPPGILLTPGTATSKRKTVTFGTEVVDKEDVNLGSSEKGETPNHLGKFPSPWNPKVKYQRKTSLTRTLENSRLGKRKNGSLKDQDKDRLNRMIADMKPRNEESTAPVNVETHDEPTEPQITHTQVLKDDLDADVTLDLNEPRSSSGKYWKSEYEKYHEAAKAEMKNLFRYKQLAKSYAKKKDAEAIDLREKLKEEQQKAAIMDEKVAKLVSQIASQGTGDGGDGSAELMKQLAWQTTLAVQYRNQVDEFQSTLAATENEQLEAKHTNQNAPQSGSPTTAQTLIETSRELKRAREQLRDMALLREEVQSLKASLHTAEQMTAKLQEEKAALSQELSDIKSVRERHMEECQNQKQILEDEQRRRQDLSTALQRDYANLKEQAKAQRKEAERLLKKRHDQVATLKQELASMKKRVTETQGQQPLRQSDIEQENKSHDQPEDIEFEKLDAESEKHPAATGSQHHEDLRNDVAINNIDGRASTREAEIFPQQSKLRADTKRRPSSSYRLRGSLPHSALSEILNGANDEANATGRPKSVAFPSGSGSSSIEIDQLRRPKSLAVPSHAKPSLGPSLDLAHRPLPQLELSLSQTPNISDIKSRTQLPPEREAAAKARLQEKFAAKRRAKALAVDKENAGT